MPKPSVAELRPVVHPAGVKDRRSGEHWGGRLYMREISLRIDRHLVGTRVTPNQLTYLMTFFAVLAAPALLVPGIAGAVLGVLMVQLYLLLDCVDGEVARWKKQFSLAGVYMDRVAAYVCDAAVLVGFGLRAADLWGSGRIDWLWAFLGTLAALGAILIKAETDLVGVARHQGGLPPVKEAASEPRSSGMALARRAAGALKFHRLVLGIEASLLILLLAVVDTVRGGLFFERLGVAVLAAVAVLQSLLHLVSVLASSRLR
ncbi:CDP-alcohol phosphatidyltransferase family protein [Streptomyces sp. SL13]|jgi:phosphatidylglycerophosphate synthase|uniref:CDP-alcohol phosphatidyltransferase family protein n=1 Tax=Streptantibioticus silvisoli TaxID=2705255 RepID=A0AA90GZR9_9ACTN|nr:CDP-alcohol phosphatidyltransferase family protein [Streptantibioticus silvisoli]MDI5963201.1 CDP-alcohol phosphatidyltransferase family protein [Streptantibioticus silvisoli]MDI5968686.1 CDP-alcohol phosphatidyltransferase family protein [Streptantibioticus silvisoli]